MPEARFSIHRLIINLRQQSCHRQKFVAFDGLQRPGVCVDMNCRRRGERQPLMKRQAQIPQLNVNSRLFTKFQSLPLSVGVALAESA